MHAGNDVWMQVKSESMVVGGVGHLLLVSVTEPSGTQTSVVVPVLPVNDACPITAFWGGHF